jgi:hypothetical protein
MILLHKKKDAEEIKDFRPINLIHSFIKLFSKLLSSRLALTQQLSRSSIISKATSCLANS